jgi:pimeloyl-ACP methyl ester carboxylesterase
MIQYKPPIRRVVERFVAILAVFGALTVLTQPFQVFPGVLAHWGGPRPEPPPWAEQSFIVTADGKSLEAWRVTPSERHFRQVAIVFHGNGDVLARAVRYQAWLREQGFLSYGFDYRGYGNSSGFPSEGGLYLDAEAVYQHVITREGLRPQDIMAFGISLGSGPAAYIASRHPIGTLALLSPYTSIPNVVRGMGLVGILAPFVWYSFPVENFIKELRDTCVVLAHGKRDTVIPWTHSQILQTKYVGASRVALLANDEGGHNDVLDRDGQRLAHALSDCALHP